MSMPIRVEISRSGHKVGELVVDSMAAADRVWQRWCARQSANHQESGCAAFSAASLLPLFTGTAAATAIREAVVTPQEVWERR